MNMGAFVEVLFFGELRLWWLFLGNEAFCFIGECSLVVSFFENLPAVSRLERVYEEFH